jgi:hypothetical protein
MNPNYLTRVHNLSTCPVLTHSWQANLQYLGFEVNR